MYDTLGVEVEAPATEWPVAVEVEGQGRCRLCSIVGPIVGDQLCPVCAGQVGSFELTARPEPHRPLYGPPQPLKVHRTHTGREVIGQWVHRPVGWVEADGDDYDIADYFDDEEDARYTERWTVIATGCPVCLEREPRHGTTCPGAPDPIVTRSMARWAR